MMEKWRRSNTFRTRERLTSALKDSENNARWTIRRIRRSLRSGRSIWKTMSSSMRRSARIRMTESRMILRKMMMIWKKEKRVPPIYDKILAGLNRNFVTKLAIKSLRWCGCRRLGLQWVVPWCRNNNRLTLTMLRSSMRPKVLLILKNHRTKKGATFVFNSYR